MCTVVFIPGNNEVFFGSLRDESPNRPRATKPEMYDVNGVSLLSPNDALAGGTWIGANNTGSIIILLNGGYTNHHRQAFYRKSRGLIVSALLSSPLPVVEWKLINMDDIEPFTLIVWSENNLFQLVWDGINKSKILLDKTQPYIWSSSTLYTEAAKEIRQTLFQKWMATEPIISHHTLLLFFHSFTNNENGFIMNRNEQIKTLSFTYIVLERGKNVAMRYQDFTTESSTNNVLTLLTGCINCLIPVAYIPFPNLLV